MTEARLQSAADLMSLILTLIVAIQSSMMSDKQTPETIVLP
jgi:hypothetical protein